MTTDTFKTDFNNCFYHNGNKIDASDIVDILNQQNDRIAELERQHLELQQLGLDLEKTDHQYIDSGHELDPLSVIRKITVLLRSF